MNSYNLNETLNIISQEEIKIRDTPISYYNFTLRKYIHSIKTEIDKKVEEWDKNKKYMNPYEFINTSYDHSSPSVCTYRPISRAFFKMIEILNNYDFSFGSSIQTFHLAEGPGGFIEAIQHFRDNKNDIYYGMTLMTEDKDIPKWNKCEQYITKNPNIRLCYGADNTGNLYHIENLIYVKENFRQSMDFITGDGGFDFSIDFNKQEENSLNLIFAEICFAMIMQKKGGSFVLKVFDTFSSTSIEMLYLLSYLYEDVYITKPSTSRPANSEKYIVCINFKLVNNLDEIINKIITIFPIIRENTITSFLDSYINNNFLDKVKEINSIFGQSQIENISLILNYIYENNSRDFYKSTKRSYLNKCIRWCKKNNMPINPIYS
jgi:23S rRNA U2552 (ribose-2'-O)-methylase RlmE/FtsJ